MYTKHDRARSLSARAGLAGLCALAATLGLAGTAAAQTGHSGSAGHQRGAHKSRFSLNGLVLSVHGGVLGVYVQRGEIAGKPVRKLVESVELPATSHHGSPARGHRAVVVGDIVHVSGIASSSNGTESLQATHDNIVTTHSTAVVGSVVSVDGTTLVVAPSRPSGGDGGGGRGGGLRRDGTDQGNLSIDASQATILVDGTEAVLTDLVANETVAVIGERDDGTMLAATVLGYTTTPSVVEGRLSSVSGSILTLSSGDSGTSTQVDASKAAIYLNGVAGATLSQLASGDKVIAIGTAGSSPLAAATVLDFNAKDDNPTGDNPGHQGGNSHQQG